jgi:hypothetical protein
VDIHVEDDVDALDSVDLDGDVYIERDGDDEVKKVRRRRMRMRKRMMMRRTMRMRRRMRIRMMATNLG